MTIFTAVYNTFKTSPLQTRYEIYTKREIERDRERERQTDMGKEKVTETQREREIKGRNSHR